MTIQDWGAIGEIIGAVATVATLLYLASQLRHNTRALQATSIDSTIQAANDIRTQLFADAEITAIYRQGLEDVDKLSDIERERFRLIMTNAIWAFWNTYTQSNLGNRQTWEVQKGIIERFLSQPGDKWFWKMYRDEFEADFRKEIDTILNTA